MTLSLYPIMVGAVWLVEYFENSQKLCLLPGCTIHESKHHHDGHNKDMLRYVLRSKAQTHGAFHVIDMATGQNRHGSIETRRESAIIQDYFR